MTKQLTKYNPKGNNRIGWKDHPWKRAQIGSLDNSLKSGFKPLWTR